MKLHASLIECDMAYLLQEPQTTTSITAHSKELMLELFRKLQGTTLNLFASLNSQHYYLEGGHRIEMVKVLVNKFHPLDDGAVQQIIASMQSLELPDYEDLSAYKNKLENFNLQLSWVGQEMSPSFLVFLAQSQLGKSRYAKDITALQMSHTASGTSFSSLDDLCLGLERLDKLHGLPFGGAAPSTKVLPKPPPKKPTTSPLGIVAAVQESDPPSPDSLEFHKDSWIGAINLPEDRVKLLRQMFKCEQCCTNEHTLPSCPLMKHWIIKRKPRSDGNSKPDTSSRPAGGVNSVLAPTTNEHIMTPEIPHVTPALTPAIEEPTDFNDDDFGNVEFDLLENFDGLAITTTNAEVTLYDALNIPLGSVSSVFSSQVSQSIFQTSSPSSFNVIIDSGSTRHMFPF
jgi:hypothetical protein